MSFSENTPSNQSLVDQVRALGPWHMNIQITEQLNTGMVFSDDGVLNRQSNSGVTLLKLKDAFLRQIDRIYPGGVSSKTFLDCACNAGGYCFWIAERGIKSALGFDVRDHWIRQARFLQSNRTVAPSDQVQFIVCDLNDLPGRNLEPFDITMFKGIFYHLPDPVSGLRIAAELTREIMFFNTSTAWGEKDGYLKCAMESRDMLMSGVDGLSWFPTGPGVIAEILDWLGFEEIKLVYNRQMSDLPHLGRIQMIASRDKGMLEKVRGDSI
jgi:2-polyprenyl-3-methyl-5-hydroxy-6-metoxy-1,4-benzoquinol methylase